MLKLDGKITLDAKAIQAKNLTDRFSSNDLTTLGEWCYDGYKRDKASRSRWEQRTEAAMDLALQIQKDKSFPWPNCSNIAFPLVTISVLQFHARAYPAIINGPDIVKMRVNGEDPGGLKRQRADRVAHHMSWQVLEEDQPWQEQHDRLLINVPCVGTAFTKDHYVPRKGFPTSELVLARDLVLDYWAKSVEECPRKTHIIPCSRNDMHEKILRGTFRDVREEAWYQGTASGDTTQNHPLDARKDKRTGQDKPQPDELTPFMTLEQHVLVDLDQDGYAEPYIITFDETSKCILRIVTGFDQESDIERTHSGEIIQVRQLQYFTKYGFIPSPDGGIMDIGFGILLGPLNESVNGIINQLVDAGTKNNTAGGFLGRGAKLKGGVYQFEPFTWQRVDASGDDLRKSIFPEPVREPSMVMFQLLSFLVGYCNRISGAVDINVGETPGQNTPAETSRNASVQGEKIYNAIYRRIWRSMGEEFKKRYILNGIYLPTTKAYGTGKRAIREDYLGNPDDICPAADPNLTSEQMAMTQAMTLKQAAMTTPGYNLEAVEHRFLRALKIDGIEEIYPGPKKVPPLPNPKLMIEQLKQQGNALKLKFARQEFVANMLEQIRLNNAQIAKLQAEATKLHSEVGVEQANAQTGALNAAVGALKQNNDAILGQVDRILQAIEMDKETEAASGTDQGGKGAEAAGGGTPGMAGTPPDQGPSADAGAMGAGGPG